MRSMGKTEGLEQEDVRSLGDGREGVSWRALRTADREIERRSVMGGRREDGGRKPKEESRGH